MKRESGYKGLFMEGARPVFGETKTGRMMMTKIAVVGTGAWGTALAIHAARMGLEVALLGRRPELVAKLAQSRKHPALPGAEILPGVSLTCSAEDAFDGARAILWAVSVQATARELERLQPLLQADVPLVMTSKGLEVSSRRTPSAIVRVVLEDGRPLAVLSGPTFAAEVAVGLPAAAVVASQDEGLSGQLQRLLASPVLRLYRSTDVIGVEIAGAAKNVVAIAAGILDGLSLGNNARAALITRALAEIRRLGTRLGGQPETFSGLAGTGDLVLTATGNLSRNRRVGLSLASGASLVEAVASLDGEVAEGVYTAAALTELAREHEVAVPIAEAVVELLSGRLEPRQAVRALMTRELKDERV